MTAPNLANIAISIAKTSTNIIGTTAVIVASNPSNSSYVVKVDHMMLISSSASWTPQCTVDLYKNGTTAYKFLPTLILQPNATLLALSKPVYLEEGDSLRVTSTIDAVVEATCSYSVVSDVSIAPILVEYLVVAGGGAGASNNGGGGGAGGLLAGTYATILANPYTITVGSGAARVTTAASQQENNGSNSVFSVITSTGGGGGASFSNSALSGKSGGSGGGAGGHDNGTANTGGAGNTPATTPSQGNNGGNGSAVNTINGGGGGGGAGSIGSTAVGGVGGNGGVGAQSSISGTTVYYAGGGGGGCTGTTAGTGGLGGGGNGSANAIGNAGTANTGGGGGAGGSYNIGSNGGSGIVIIAYPRHFKDITTIGAGLTYTLDTISRPGYNVYKFTAGTGTITW